jgi:exodeoxyribonuclease V alpha subunit
VVPLLTSHAALLGRTLLYTAVTRAQSLVVIVGQQRALAMAVKDWRRVARHTALAGLLTGALRFTWPRTTSMMPEAEPVLGMPEAWEGLLGEGAA